MTYLKAFDPIRELFAATKDARARGLTASHFSFNVPGGRCEACEGEGVVRVEMQFLADVFVPCEQCDGKRFRPQVLEVRYKGTNIDQVLDLTVREALTFFAGAPKVTRRLQVLDEIGLGYLRLGQPATTLSGGEAQRIKIASHLGSQSGERMLYVLDEPTTGLHFDDIVKLLAAFRKLLQAGHSLLVIEHNLDVLKTADWIIDLGPEGGEAGGYVVAVGHARARRDRRRVRTPASICAACLRPAATTRTLIRHERRGESDLAAPTRRCARLVDAVRRDRLTAIASRASGPVELAGRHPQPAASGPETSGSTSIAAARRGRLRRGGRSRSRRSILDPDDRVQAAAIEAELDVLPDRSGQRRADPRLRRIAKPRRRRRSKPVRCCAAAPAPPA